jgi:hypothetical protein
MTNFSPIPLVITNESIGWDKFLCNGGVKYSGVAVQYQLWVSKAYKNELFSAVVF